MHIYEELTEPKAAFQPLETNLSFHLLMKMHLLNQKRNFDSVNPT